MIDPAPHSLCIPLHCLPRLIYAMHEISFLSWWYFTVSSSSPSKWWSSFRLPVAGRFSPTSFVRLSSQLEKTAAFLLGYCSFKKPEDGPVMIVGCNNVVVPNVVFIYPGTGEQTIIPHGRNSGRLGICVFITTNMCPGEAPNLAQWRRDGVYWVFQLHRQLYHPQLQNTAFLFCCEKPSCGNKKSKPNTNVLLHWLEVLNW